MVFTSSIHTWSVYCQYCTTNVEVHCLGFTYSGQTLLPFIYLCVWTICDGDDRKE